MSFALPKRLGFKLAITWTAALLIALGLIVEMSLFLLQAESEKNANSRLTTFSNAMKMAYGQGGLEGIRSDFTLFIYKDRIPAFVRFQSGNEQFLLLEPTEANGVSLLDLLPAFDPRVSGVRHSSGWHIMNAMTAHGGILEVGFFYPTHDSQPSKILLLLVSLGIGMLAILLGSLVTWQIVHPFTELRQRMEGVLNQSQVAAQGIDPPSSSQELVALTGLFNRLMEKNARLNDEIRQALDNVAHDLRTPMTRLRASAEQALQQPASIETCREALEDCMEESEKVITLLNAMMDLAEAEAGGMKLTREKHSLHSIVERIRDLFEFTAEEKNVVLENHVPPEITVYADRVRLEQVLANLVDNAIKYIGPGNHVDITARLVEGRVEIEVSDNGTGIPEGELPKIWTRLYRGHQSRSQRGLGLGLSFVKAIVEAHGGTVRVKNRAERGAIFTLRLPQV